MATFLRFCCLKDKMTAEEETDDNEEPSSKDWPFQNACCDKRDRKQLYILMVEGSICTEEATFFILVCNDSSRASRKGSCQELLDLMNERGAYLCCAGNDILKFEFPNQQIMDNFVKQLTRHYLQEYGISEENIKDCTISFVDLLSSINKDDQEVVTALQNIQTKVQDLLSERVLSKFAIEDEYELLDIVFLPLFQSGLNCRVWHREEIDITLYNRKCVVLMKMECTRGSTAADCLRSIYKLNLQELFDRKVFFPDGVEECILIGLNLNLDKKSVSVCCSHERNCGSTVI